MACTCGRIVLGSEATGSRNWNPDCPEHGIETAWWRSDVQVAHRRYDGARLRVIQAVARLRRNGQLDLEGAQAVLDAVDGVGERSASGGIADLLDAGEEAVRALERITGRPAPLSGGSEVQDALRAMAAASQAEQSDAPKLYDLQATGTELGAVHRILEAQIGVLEAWASMRHTTDEEAKALRHDAGLLRSFVERNYEEEDATTATYYSGDGTQEIENMDGAAADTLGHLQSSQHPHKSDYSPLELGETGRLSIQGSRTSEFDRGLFSAALEGRPAGQMNLRGLDIGCADGALTVDRFESTSFSRVLGIDANEDVIAAANATHAGGPFVFARVDVEALSAEADIRALMEDQEVPGFDVIFAALVLHHLANPIKVLRLARHLLNPGGAVIVRSTDDGVKIAYPDGENRLGKVLDATMRQRGVSDRQHGRKIYYQLYRAGFRDISIFAQTTHSDGMGASARHALFLESFAYRRNYLRRAVAECPDDSGLRGQLKEMDRLLGELELDFEDDSFFYLEMDIAGVARIPWR